MFTDAHGSLRTTRTQGLRADTSGTILLIGLVAGALLVGTLWHLVSVGDAILWREGAQNAADAAAFQASVLQARGMNVIVVLNLIMALVMSVLVAWRVAEILVFALIIIMGIVTAITFGATAPVEQALVQAMQFLVSKDPQVSRIVVNICSGINVAEKVVATVTPLLAIGEASIDTSAGYNVNALALTPSIASPTIIDKGGVKDNFVKGFKDKFLECFNQGKGKTKTPEKKPDPVPATPPTRGKVIRDEAVDWWKDATGRRMGFIISLPVQEDSLGALCGRSATMFDTVLAEILGFGPTSGVQKSLHYVSDLKKEIFDAMSTFFCKPMDQAFQDLMGWLVDRTSKLVKEQCEQGGKDFAKMPEDQRKKHEFYSEPGGFGSDIDPDTGFDTGKCKKARKKEVADNMKKMKKAQDEMLQTIDCVKPAKVWSASKNGNFFMQSFSFVDKDAPHLAGNDRGLEVGDRQRTGSVTAVEVPGIRAQAEMYFDCDNAWFYCGPNAMWQVNWRARLRRIQPFSRMAAEAAMGAAVNGMIGSVMYWMEKFVKVKSPGGLSNFSPVKWTKTKIDKYISKNVSPKPDPGSNAEEIH